MLPLLLLLLCVAVLLLWLQQQCCCFLTLFVIMCRMLKYGAGAINLIPVFCSPSFKRDLLLTHPLAVLCRIYGLYLPTTSVIAGVRKGVSPPRPIPPFNMCKDILAMSQQSGGQIQTSF